ncbi:methyltransferase domain-containing protein [Flavobacterium supellecticarium]|uniref:Methyltransferase domain-containing protein n=1 Tax=Flavobacterium supellecticarium TaxID=2565924 RepID=A0A4S3ZTA3_9FLAO|nr:class I SAM-dependent methyltransferase [Flavobacterium supellecticarium]THF48824.1 methyltransferase domain-containing protein [Flavobacterium supellecticarium]
MNASFDIAAATYDQTFTHTVIGRLQRDLVYRQMTEMLQNSSIRSILEINCGTGEDALWLSEQGYQVTATDISEQMILTARQKDTVGTITFRQADINTLPATFPNQTFDALFSDFGGLNCLSESELEAFFENANRLLNPNGRLFLVIMPKNTLWEQLYFLLKGQWKAAFRRKREKAIVNIDGEAVATYYYNPAAIKRMAQRHFAVTHIQPVGFFIPPSYLEPFVKNKKRLTAVLGSLENTIRNVRFLSRYSDHYFIALQKR